MRLQIVALTVLLFSSAGNAQLVQSSASRIVWDAKTNCHQKNNAQIAKDTHCDTQKQSGQNYHTIFYKGIYSSVAYRKSNSFVVAEVHISNVSGASIEVDPAFLSINIYKDVDAFFSGTDASHVFRSIAPNRIEVTVRSSQDGTKSKDEIGEGLRVEDRNKYDKNAKPIIELQPKAPPDERQSAIKSSGQTLISESKLKKALVPKKVAERETVSGYVFFRRPKEDGYVVIMLKIGDINFVFPLDK